MSMLDGEQPVSIYVRYGSDLSLKSASVQLSFSNACSSSGVQMASEIASGRVCGIGLPLTSYTP